MTTTTTVSYGRNSSAREKPIEDQLAHNRAEAERLGWTITDELSDGTSASRFASKARKNWAAILDAVPNVDVVMLWEPSRGDRDLESWVAFVARCREHGTKIYASGHRDLLDPRNMRHWKTLIEDGLDSAMESEKSSARLLRGYVGQAERGRPHSQTTYGYERVYHPQTRALVEQRPHPQHADVVREIVRRIGEGAAISVVARDLTTRGVPTPLGAAKWSNKTIRDIARNRAYIGVRVHTAERRTDRERTEEYPACWPALVTDAEHYAAVRVLSAPERRTARHRPRDGKATTLCGNLVECGTCGGRLAARRDVYRCCPSLPIVDLDVYVTGLIVARLTDPDVYQQMRHAGDSADQAAVTARAEIDRLTSELHGWRESAVRGETSPASLAHVESGLTSRIADARRRAEQTSMPPTLRAMVGTDEAEVLDRFESAPLGARRDVVRRMLQMTARATTGRGRPVTERVDISWR